MLGMFSHLVLAGSLLAADNVYDELTKVGVRLTATETVRLPMPALSDDLDVDAEAKILKTVAGKYPLDRFTHHSIVSPFVLEITSVEGGGQKRNGQRLDFYFVAYGDLEALMDDKLFQELVGVQEAKTASPRPMSVRSLTPAELSERQLTPRETDQLVESYVVIDMPILERVQLSGIGMTIKQKNPDSMLGAFRLEERFVDDPTFPNHWQPILRDQLGRLSLGPASPFSGLGGYIKITRLKSIKSALLVECHAAFHEPYGWFEGKNLLRSKLPLVVQDNVRTFRRKLSKLESAAVSGGAAK